MNFVGEIPCICINSYNPYKCCLVLLHIQQLHYSYITIHWASCLCVVMVPAV